MTGGARVAPAEPIEAIRARARAELAALPKSLLEIPEPTPMWTPFLPATSRRLDALVETVRARVGAQHH
jgi:nicotinate phosphoribosyltransferase